MEVNESRSASLCAVLLMSTHVANFFIGAIFAEVISLSMSFTRLQASANIGKVRRFQEKDLQIMHYLSIDILKGSF